MRQELILAAAAVLLLTAPAARADEPTPTYAQVKQILSDRCQSCHSENPDQPGIYEAPNGVKFDTAQEIHLFAQKIMEKAVITQVMPLGNITNITDQERKTLGAWIIAGAKIP